MYTTRKHHINTIKSAAAHYAGVSYRSIRGFHVVDSDEQGDGSMVYFVKGYSDETINGKLRVLVRLLPIK
jgi:hypothetical protein